MVDFGHNAATTWKPGTYLRQQGIQQLEMLAITNHDEDHASASADLFDNVRVSWLLRNKSVSGTGIKTLKTEEGMGPGIERLVREIDTYTSEPTAASPEPMFQGLERQVFYNEYPTFDDENNLSMVLFLKCHGFGVMFTGDLEKAGFQRLLQREPFQQALLATNVYIASHHGRENGCCPDLTQYVRNVFYVVIFDKGYMYDTQQTLPFYQQIAKGGPFRGANRTVLTTRIDGRIGFHFSPGSWGPY